MSVNATEIEQLRTGAPREVPYWCDRCEAHYTGNEALQHKGSRCYAGQVAR